jgi:hypothetical protein
MACYFRVSRGPFSDLPILPILSGTGRGGAGAGFGCVWCMVGVSVRVSMPPEPRMALSLSGEGRETLAFDRGGETFTPGRGVDGRFIFRSLGEAPFYPPADAVVSVG